MPITQLLMTPGMGTLMQAVHRNVFAYKYGERYLPVGRWIKGSASADPGNTGDVRCLRAGLLMGKQTSGGYLAPSILGATGVLHDTSVVTTTMTLPAAIVTEIQRRIGSSGTFKITGPPTANGTVATETVTFSAIASATTLTITATSADFAAGSFIQPTDGSETPVTFLPDGYPIRVSDGTTTYDPEFPMVPVGGVIKSDWLIDWPSDTSLRAWIVSKLTTAGVGNYTFTHLI